MRLVSLVSGGIDSPVASYLMASAGADVDLLHMDNGRFGDPGDLDKVLEVSRVLEAATGRRFPVYAADHGPVLEALCAGPEPGYRCVMCKRSMQAVAKAFALRTGAAGVVMGDSLGQVASQTLRNIGAELGGPDLPILRPLIGLDKTEIIDVARRIGTYGVSISGSSGCGAVPVRPATEARPERVAAISEAVGFEDAVARCAESVRRVLR